MGGETVHSQFQKVLVARYSPQNECYADGGDVLYPPIPQNGPKPRTGAKYYFRSARDSSKVSKFGWVRSLDRPFNARDFVEEHLHVQVPDEQIAVLSDLLSAIASLPDDTPVAGSYFLRGVEDRHLELDFHKVIFYRDDRG